MLVWHHRRLDLTSAIVAAADDERNVDSLGGHRGEPRLELRAFWRMREVSLILIVDRKRHSAHVVSLRIRPISRQVASPASDRYGLHAAVDRAGGERRAA